MHIVFSLFYAPFVFYSLKHFDIRTVSLIIFATSLIWFLFALKKDMESALFPFFYICVSLLCFFIGSFIILKSLPLLISVLVGLYFFYSFLTKNSVIITFAKRFKKNISQKEEQYIQGSSLIWVAASLVNIFIHSFVLLDDNINYWIIYSTFGWYFVFVTAFIVQMIHKKLFFKETI